MAHMKPIANIAFTTSARAFTLGADRRVFGVSVID